jgi:anthranilate phosphoribosyltransferase
MGLVISKLAANLEEGYLNAVDALKQGRVKTLLRDVVEYSQEAK